MKFEALTTIYTPETIAALENYREHLRESRMRLEETEKLALQTLEEYDSAGSSQNFSEGINRPGKPDRNTSGPMVNIARRYGALAKEVEAIRMEIKRLGV
jgi:diphthamide biosynthesis protein 3